MNCGRSLHSGPHEKHRHKRASVRMTIMSGSYPRTVITRRYDEAIHFALRCAPRFNSVAALGTGKIVHAADKRLPRSLSLPRNDDLSSGVLGQLLVRVHALVSSASFPRSSSFAPQHLLFPPKRENLQLYLQFRALLCYSCLSMNIRQVAALRPSAKEPEFRPLVRHIDHSIADASRE